MAFDGIFTGVLVNELKTAVDSHIDKIYQPSNSEICLILRKKGFVKRLMISVKNGMARVHFTEMKPENPEKPPMFCMLLRKYFSSARLTDVSQKGFERIVEFTFEATNELGDRIKRKIVCELIGNMGNVVLLSEDGKIIDALRRTDICAERIIMSGAVYKYPIPQEKYDIFSTDTAVIVDKISSLGETLLSKAVLDTVGGVSPIICREIIFLSKLSDVPVCEISEFSSLKNELEKLKALLCSAPVPFMLIKNGVPFDFSYLPILQYNNLCENKEFETFGQLLDAFYLQREKNAAKNRITGDVSKYVQTLISRAEKRLSARKNELLSCEKREILRIKGELIKANISNICSGAKEITVKNFYDENLSDIKIMLDPSLSPQNNAQKYFKEYKKKSIAASTLLDLIEKDNAEIDYLSSVFDNLSRCETLSDLREIKNELYLSGYIKRTESKKQKAPTSAFKELRSAEGFKIIVGKNNIQNDLITTKLSGKNDMWFHTKNVHGSHVVVFSGGEALSDETIVFAAKLAAKNSRAQNSSNVPVDYTKIKYVKKPSGAKPGMVIYTNNKTVFVTPEGENL
ncbi:MAG: NFACT family protein [Clostridia bacterium]|nr:NFACT family protein [Clostridia bacterium]